MSGHLNMDAAASLLQWLAIYTSAALLVGCRLLSYANKNLDSFDWILNRRELLRKIFRSVIFWPLLFFKPAKLIRPKFQFAGNFLVGDAAVDERKRAAFMNKPPFCGKTVSYRPSSAHGWAHGNGEFLFSASDAQNAAVTKWRGNPNLPGIRGAIWWLALRDENVSETTPVPDMLVNFNKVALDMIDTKLGQVKCPECNKIYSNSELDRYTEGMPTVYEHIICPAKHELFIYELMHFCLRRGEDDSKSEESNRYD